MNHKPTGTSQPLLFTGPVVIFSARKKKKKIFAETKVRCMRAHPLYEHFEPARVTLD